MKYLLISNAISNKTVKNTMLLFIILIIIKFNWFSIILITRERERLCLNLSNNKKME